MESTRKGESAAAHESAHQRINAPRLDRPNSRLDEGQRYTGQRKSIQTRKDNSEMGRDTHDLGIMETAWERCNNLRRWSILLQFTPIIDRDEGNYRIPGFRAHKIELYRDGYSDPEWRRMWNAHGKLTYTRKVTVTRVLVSGLKYPSRKYLCIAHFLG